MSDKRFTLRSIISRFQNAKCVMAYRERNIENKGMSIRITPGSWQKTLSTAWTDALLPALPNCECIMSEDKNTTMVSDICTSCYRDKSEPGGPQVPCNPDKPRMVWRWATNLRMVCLLVHLARSESHHNISSPGPGICFIGSLKYLWHLKYVRHK